MSDMQKISWYKSHHRDTEDTESLIVSRKKTLCTQCLCGEYHSC